MTELFTMGSVGAAHRNKHSIGLDRAQYAVIDLETTGFSARSDRVIEVGVSRVDSQGRVLAEYSSLVNAGVDAGPTFVHHITNEMLSDAPTFADVAPSILALMDGAVVVAHNAPFEDRFLALEFAKARIRLPKLPAICTLELARQHLGSPNHKLGTCCEYLGIELNDSHTALGDVRATSKLVIELIKRAGGEGQALVFNDRPGQLPTLGNAKGPKTRVSGLSKGETGWMSGLLSKLPVTSYGSDPSATEAYLEALALAMSDGKIIGSEAKMLAKLAGQAGMSAQQVDEFNVSFLRGIEKVALEDGKIDAKEMAYLKRSALALGHPELFDSPTTPAIPVQTKARVAPAVVAPAAPAATAVATAQTVELNPVTGLPPAGWYSDPTGRHARRWWNASNWTEHVADADGLALDPL